MTHPGVTNSGRRDLVSQVETRGYAIIKELVTDDHLDWLRSQVDQLCEQLPRGRGLLVRRGRVYGIRNVLDLRPELGKVLMQIGLDEVLSELVSPQWGVVRLQYLDKPPEASWTLPWHRDRTIAVSAHGIDYRRTQVTTKAGVTHVEGSPRLLSQMIAVRVNLDPATTFNGPLEVIVGSHLDPSAVHRHDEKPAHRNASQITCAAGDVVVMRPLLLHRSGHSKEPARGHRRVLHFECGPKVLEDGGLRWHWFQDFA